MRRFELPVFSADMGLNEAFAELFEAKVSGLVIQGSNRNYRLIGFDHMTEAVGHGVERLGLVKGYRLPLLEDVSGDQEANNLLIKLGRTVGLLKVYERSADLLAISENKAGGYQFSSSVVRCDRPNKPSGQSNQDWYHYYPPHSLPSPMPHRCVAAGCAGMIR
jgi:hypothetical protein